MSDRVFDIDNLPKGTSWVNALSVEAAKKQCVLLGLAEPRTLAEARGALVTFLKSRSDVSSPDVGGRLVEPKFVPSIPRATQAPSEQVSDHPQHEVEPADGPHIAPAPPEPAIVQQTPTLDVASLVHATAVAVSTQLAGFLAAKGPQSASRPAVPDSVARELFRAIPPASGAQPESLVSFLVQTQKLVSLGLLEERDVLINLLPKTTDQLRVKWLQALAEPTDFGVLKRQLVHTFVPQRVQHVLLTTLLYRAQRPGESVAHFADDLVQVAALLAPALDMPEIFEVVMTGLNPTTRAGLAGFPPPMTLAELLVLEPRMLAIANIHDGGTSVQRPAAAPAPVRGNAEGFSGGRVSDGIFHPNERRNWRPLAPGRAQPFSYPSRGPYVGGFQNRRSQFPSEFRQSPPFEPQPARGLPAPRETPNRGYSNQLNSQGGRK